MTPGTRIVARRNRKKARDDEWLPTIRMIMNAVPRRNPRSAIPGRRRRRF
jgi:hypothetical protein